METGFIDKDKIQDAFDKAVRPDKEKHSSWEYGGYNIYLTVRNFFFGEKKIKKNDNKFADIAETLLSTISDEPNVELLSTSENSFPNKGCWKTQEQGEDWKDGLQGLLHITLYLFCFWY